MSGEREDRIKEIRDELAIGYHANWPPIAIERHRAARDLLEALEKAEGEREGLRAVVRRYLRLHENGCIECGESDEDLSDDARHLLEKT